jgi:hypothetical protein
VTRDGAHSAARAIRWLRTLNNWFPSSKLNKAADDTQAWSVHTSNGYVPVLHIIEFMVPVWLNVATVVRFSVRGRGRSSRAQAHFISVLSSYDNTTTMNEERWYTAAVSGWRIVIVTRCCSSKRPSLPFDNPLLS